jgi:hypothetical protein
MTDDVSAPLPDLDWPDRAIIAVNAGDTNAKITKLVIHLSQDVPEDLTPVQPFVPLFTYGSAQ